ncbi:23S rRNA pseudouridine2605 synthase [Pseudoxanthomonas sp. GM95]|uniref:pseudouridine synthase n=1 Tax=Pseudoxanthomonas sp. GM95 TaxID=1881043 RepID=UPI0008D5B211|nr:pseudouridine synthase [Pseudoxanthomonas sp. GM95]SEK64362.1 23S rRNA pseudouridine2605 synthase [Pseudoxanthomonas sp. GM95]
MTVRKPAPVSAPRHGLARALSKLGLCSRTEAARWIAIGRVRVDGRVVLDPEFPTIAGRSCIEVDGLADAAAPRRYLMLNKPRGLVTTAADERGRDTIYRCFDGAGLPWLAPVGRLDKASEGLLLMSNDPVWAATITDPATGPSKTYHVQVDAIPDPALLQQLEQGTSVEGEHLRAARATLLRSGARNAWLEITLDEGRNRQIRRLLEAYSLATLRLVRVAIGELPLGELAKGTWRDLTPDEVRALAPPSATG